MGRSESTKCVFENRSSVHGLHHREEPPVAPCLAAPVDPVVGVGEHPVQHPTDFVLSHHGGITLLFKGFLKSQSILPLNLLLGTSLVRVALFSRAVNNVGGRMSSTMSWQKTV